MLLSTLRCEIYSSSRGSNKPREFPWSGSLGVFFYQKKQTMSRKQPIPTTFLSNQSLDILDRMLFSYLWSMTRNEDWYVNFYHWNKYISHFLKRWQVIFKAKSISDNLKIGYKRVQRSIEKIKKTENEMEIERKSFWQIITWVWYDERIKMEIEMENERKSKGKWKENEGWASNKSDKNVKSVKDWKEEFEEVWKLYPKKTWKAESMKKYIKLKPDVDLVKKKIQEYKDFLELEKSRWFDRKPKDWSSRFNQQWWLDEYEVKTIIDKRKELQTKKRETHWTDEQDKYIKQLNHIKEQVLEETGRTDKEYVLQAQRSNFI